VTDAAAAAWLEVLGLLIANVAHKSHNVLNATMINLHVLVSRLSPTNIPTGMSGADLSTRTLVHAENASKALDSTSELVHSMLALARPLPVPADPSRMLTDIIRVVTADAREGAPVLDVEVQDPILGQDAGPEARLAIAAGVRALHRSGRGGTVRWVAREVTLAQPNGGANAKPILTDEILRILADAGFSVHARTELVTFSIPEGTVSA
jgi:hypothetical protein